MYKSNSLGKKKLKNHNCLPDYNRMHYIYKLIKQLEINLINFLIIGHQIFFFFETKYSFHSKKGMKANTQHRPNRKPAKKR